MRNRPDQVERGVLNARIGLNTFSAFLSGPGVAPHDAAHLLVVQVFGEGGPGGTVRKAKNPLSVFGRLVMKLAVPRITSAASSIGQSIGPA